MVNFLFVLVVFTLAYGVSRYVILNPFTERSWKTLGELVFVPYFQLYGELFLDYPQELPGKSLYSKTSLEDIFKGVYAIEFLKLDNINLDIFKHLKVSRINY